MESSTCRYCVKTVRVEVAGQLCARRILHTKKTSFTPPPPPPLPALSGALVELRGERRLPPVPPT